MKTNGLIKRWILIFGEEVDKKIIKEHVTSAGNHLWHLFTWGKVPCIEGNEARIAFDNLQYTEAIKFCGGYSNHIKKTYIISKISAEQIDKELESDVYIVAKDFSWTYVRTHEENCGPYLCIKNKNEN